MMQPIISGHARTDDRWWAALPLIDETSLRSAGEYWKAHVNPMFAGMIVGDGFKFDTPTQQYIRTNGRKIKNDERRAIFLAFLASASDSMERNAQTMTAGATSLSDWQARQAQDIKDLYIAAAALGVGGLALLTGEDLNQISVGPLADSMTRLRRFGGQIEAGEPTAESVSQIVNRAGLYAGPAHGIEEQAIRDAHLRATDKDGAAIQWEEQNVLTDPADHCRDGNGTIGCIEETERGWVPIGTLSLPGFRTCGPQCLCRISYRQLGLEMNSEMDNWVFLDGKVETISACY